jgi:hypothetical protein
MIAQDALNRIASRLWNVNEEKTFLKRNHLQRVCQIYSASFDCASVGGF